ncbi:OTU domain, ubiquitin aldehyde binding [Balamuthia mandrillaris]
MARFVGEERSLDGLCEEYRNEELRKKINALKAVYPRWHAIRGDGNCFYRAVWTGYSRLFCRLPTDEHNFEEERLRFQNVLCANQHLFHQLKPETKELLFAQLKKLSLSPPHNENEASTTEATTNDEATEASKKEEEKEEELFSQLINDEATSDGFVLFLRLLTSDTLRKGKDFYSLFLDDDDDDKGGVFEQRCQRAETMGEEAEQLEMVALLSALGVSAKVWRLERGGKGITSVVLPDDSKKQQLLTLLYRPGHYDLLLPRASCSGSSSSSSSSS